MIAHSLAFVQKQQTMLLTLLSHISGTGFKQEVQEAAPNGELSSLDDVSANVIELEQALGTVGRVAEQSRLIQSALQRIEEGTYGICEVSGQLIPEERLEVIPWATTTVAVQAELERKQGNQRQSRNYRLFDDFHAVTAEEEEERISTPEA